MMNTEKTITDIIRERRTIHQFKKNEMVPEEFIIKALEHAIWAPNHHRTYPWHFYMLNADTIKRICELNADLVRADKGDKAAEIKLRRWLEIPGWLLLTCDISDDSICMDEDFATCCCAAQNMMLYLWEQGVGMKWTTGAVTRDPKFFQLLEIDPGLEKVVGLFWYGYPDDIPVMERPPVSEYLHYR